MKILQIIKLKKKVFKLKDSIALVNSFVLTYEAIIKQNMYV